MFPISGGPDIPWAVLEPFAAQAYTCARALAVDALELAIG